MISMDRLKAQKHKRHRLLSINSSVSLCLLFGIIHSPSSHASNILQQLNEDLQHQLSKVQKEVEIQKVSISRCINVVKELLIEKSRIERKEARSKVMQNRLRLGQFVTQRVGATFQVISYL